MLVFVVVRDLCTAYYNLQFIKFLLVLFLNNDFDSMFSQKRSSFISVIFKELLTLENLLAKILMWPQSVDVARWVRPAIEHAQDVLSGGLGQEVEYDFVLVF